MRRSIAADNRADAINVQVKAKTSDGAHSHRRRLADVPPDKTPQRLDSHAAHTNLDSFALYAAISRVDGRGVAGYRPPPKGRLDR
ncbi:MAG: hypothetical protein DCC68_03500 [Planctomycetota bacterium]|nr:MAG: hypothetical protein DCC68_03500 [Planctomycetota bacterium]